ncbi:MAG: Cof-type HAD-IIB family hydrolase [Oscillospiraceae bacterium]|nr:Cof-type HAD-IIB family hydrolase [Oscillospiraceae bacterium]
MPTFAPKLIVTDLDGTLLRRDKTISQYTVDIFAKCRARGIKIAFATARPVRSVAALAAKALIAPDALAYHNGVIIEIDGAITHRFGIPHEMAASIVGKSLSIFPSMRVFVETDDFLYVNYDDFPCDSWRINCASLTDLPCKIIDKICFVTPQYDEPISLDVIAGIKTLLSDDLRYLLVEGAQYMPVTSKQAGKDLACQHFATRYDIATADIVAFGDDYNDLEMLRACGVGVAMGNACEGVCEAVDLICDSNENDGVAKWLEENVLNN